MAFWINNFVRRWIHLSKKDITIKEASEKGHIDLIKYLVKNGANIHVEEEYPFFIAVENGHIDLVKLAVENGVDINKDNSKALLRASLRGHFPVVKYLVESGSNIHSDSFLEA